MLRVSRLIDKWSAVVWGIRTFAVYNKSKWTLVILAPLGVAVIGLDIVRRSNGSDTSSDGILVSCTLGNLR